MDTKDNSHAVGDELDPVTVSVIRGKINQLTNEMDAALAHSAFSPVINEGHDMGNGIYRPDGRTIAQGERSLPVFAGNMRFSVSSIAEQFQGDIKDGDTFIVNDPYKGGTHLNDVKLIKPFFAGGKLIAFFANTGHWMDIGSGTPGSFNGTSENIFEDGIRIPPLKLYEEHTLNESVLELILTNVRNADDISGDFKAQLNSLRAAEERFGEIIEEYSVEVVKDTIEELERSSEVKMRSRIEQIPDGVYNFTDYLDNDGVRDAPLKITVEMEVSGSDITLDFSGSAGPAAGPLNAPMSTTISGCHIALKHVFPDIPINAGCFKPVDYIIPSESCLNAKPPSATMGYTAVCQRVVDVVLGVLGEAIPEKVPAQAFSTSCANRISGFTDEGEEFTIGEVMAGGYGGSKEYDGLTHCTPPYATARGRGVEVMENRGPVIFTEKKVRENSEGAGRQRGGFGTVYEIELLGERASVSILGDRADFPPKGMGGGGDAMGVEITFFNDSGEYTPPLKTKAKDVEMTRGDRFRMESPGGGGYGDPYERSPSQVLEDVKYGYISMQRARDVYGVQIEKDGIELMIDTEKTKKYRAENRDRK